MLLVKKEVQEKFLRFQKFNSLMIPLLTFKATFLEPYHRTVSK